MFSRFNNTRFLFPVSDGNMLLALDKSNLHELLNISNPLHEKALLYAIDDVREKGIKMPGTLWEYKVIWFVTLGLL